MTFFVIYHKPVSDRLRNFLTLPVGEMTFPTVQVHSPAHRYNFWKQNVCLPNAAHHFFQICNSHGGTPRDLDIAELEKCPLSHMGHIVLVHTITKSYGAYSACSHCH